MKGINRSTALAIAVGVFFSTALHAQIIQQAATCNGCTLQQVQALLPNCSRGYRYVGDFEADRLYLGCYKVKGMQPESSSKHGVTPQRALPRAGRYVYRQTSSNAQGTFQVYQSVYASNGHRNLANARVSVGVGLRPSVSLGDDGYMNAYDVVHAVQNMDAVKTWLMTTTFTKTNTVGLFSSGTASPELGAKIAQLLNNIKSSVISFNYQIDVTVVFHDGSRVSLKFNNALGTWSYIKGSARDAHGNLVPDSYASVGGNNGTAYSFTNPHPTYDLTNFERTLQEDGIKVTGATGGLITGIVCTETKKQVVCSYTTIAK